MLLDYIYDIHKNLDKIDWNSTITVRDRSIKMFKIKLPEWEEGKVLVMDSPFAQTNAAHLL